MTEEILKRQLAAIPDAELLENCENFLLEICKTGQRPYFSIPPYYRDFDMQISELYRRFKMYSESAALIEAKAKEVTEIIKEVIGVIKSTLNPEK